MFCGCNHSSGKKTEYLSHFLLASAQFGITLASTLTGLKPLTQTESCSPPGIHLHSHLLHDLDLTIRVRLLLTALFNIVTTHPALLLPSRLYFLSIALTPSVM